MNYIQQLKADLSGQIATVESFKQHIHEFRAYLNSPKFTGTENGERKDWIATADVLHWLRETESAALNHGETVKSQWRPPSNETD